MTRDKTGEHTGPPLPATPSPTTRPRTPEYRPPSIGGTEAHLRLLARLPELTALTTAQLVEHIAVYARLPAEEIDGEVRDIAAWLIRTFAETLRTGRPPEAADLDRLRLSAAKRAEEGVAADAVVSAYHVGACACADDLFSRAEPDDLPDVLALNRTLVDYLGRVCAAVTAGYTEEYRALLGEGTAERQSLLSTLLAGEWEQGAPDHAGVRPEPCYLVLSLSVGTHPDEHASGVDTAVAARRKVRRLRTELERHSAAPVLTRISPSEGVALLPHPGPPTHVADRDWQRVEELLRMLTRTAGVPVTAGAAPSDPGGVPEAARLAAQLRTIAVSGRRPPGLYRLTDLLLEYQLTRPGPALDHLVGLLSPGLDHPDLLPTLRSFLDSDLNRRSTATRLGVHPNTVDYRLRRLTRRTGLDLARNHDRMLARAALAALDLREGEATEPGP
ncbi:helix-turn-helix domain-containing protein [Nocardiopsis sp. HNM0947]|uniref:Helix-turn-helix domain-containing protein n=1 Tax=Nocardiopsis coralli TaxID=2772213 RepID=A0ABR9PDK5_9ACTN|nr:helix-turn-helix domain-containing protein [Nocardiopsis coralli]MBE3001933.1 helix-turn-helix domain-containing protein [Nocardiopsis coralli]